MTLDIASTQLRTNDVSDFWPSLPMTLGLWGMWSAPPFFYAHFHIYPILCFLSTYISTTLYCLYCCFSLKARTLPTKQLQNKFNYRSFLIIKQQNTLINMLKKSYPVGSKILTLQHCNDYCSIQHAISEETASCQCLFATASFIKKETAIINTNHSDSRNSAINKPIKMESNIMRWTLSQRYVQVLFPYGILCYFILKPQN